MPIPSRWIVFLLILLNKFVHIKSLQSADQGRNWVWPPCCKCKGVGLFIVMDEGNVAEPVYLEKRKKFWLTALHSKAQSSCLVWNIAEGINNVHSLLYRERPSIWDNHAQTTSAKSCCSGQCTWTQSCDTKAKIPPFNVHCWCSVQKRSLSSSLSISFCLYLSLSPSLPLPTTNKNPQRAKTIVSCF